MRLFPVFMSIVVRTSVPPLNEIEPLRKEVRGATGDQVLYDTFTMEQLASASLARQRFLLLLFGVFAGLALLLACVGIYGVLVTGVQAMDPFTITLMIALLVAAALLTSFAPARRASHVDPMNALRQD